MIEEERGARLGVPFFLFSGRERLPQRERRIWSSAHFDWGAVEIKPRSLRCVCSVRAARTLHTSVGMTEDERADMGRGRRLQEREVVRTWGEDGGCKKRAEVVRTWGAAVLRPYRRREMRPPRKASATYAKKNPTLQDDPSKVRARRIGTRGKRGGTQDPPFA